MNSINELARLVANAKLVAKSDAAMARQAAPKGEKMAHGQHAQSLVGMKIAAAIQDAAPRFGFVASAGAVKKDKVTGEVKEMTVTYRPAQTLAHRVETYKNAAARRAEKRAAAKAGNGGKTVAEPTQGAPSASELEALLGKKAA